jgi:hypothetical protein
MVNVTISGALIMNEQAGVVVEEQKLVPFQYATERLIKV